MFDIDIDLAFKRIAIQLDIQKPGLGLLPLTRSEIFIHPPALRPGIATRKL
ncbi:hypothetical protein Plhal710r2_c029g0110501 [Plasmopara halstedii]